MTNAQDHHLVAPDAVADDVGISCHQLAHVSAADRAATVREIHQAVACVAQAFGYVHSRARIEIIDVVIGTKDRGKRRFGPDDAHNSGGRRRDSLAFSQFRKPLDYFVVRHDLPSLVRGLGFRIEASFQSFVRFDIEDRFCSRFSHRHLPTGWNSSRIWD